LYDRDVNRVYACVSRRTGSRTAAEDRPYGERSGFIRDQYGNHWYIATSLGPSVVPKELQTVTPFLHAQNVDEYIGFLQRAVGSEIQHGRSTAGPIVSHVASRRRLSASP
jgi:hypothetical protein